MLGSKKMKTTIDGKNAELTTLGVCATCPSKKETNFYSSDGWDRMVDWVCAEKENKKIANAVEWHEEKRVQLPVWCPRTTIKAVEKEFVYILQINDFLPKSFTSESFAFEAVLDFINRKHKDINVASITNFNTLNVILNKVKVREFKYTLSVSYTNELIPEHENIASIVSRYRQ